MTHESLSAPGSDLLDGPTVALVRLSACIAAGTDEAVRRALEFARDAGTPERWVEELILQSYLFAGFPRALNAARAWRRPDSSTDVPGSEHAYRDADVVEWRQRGEVTCATVYGDNYLKLRANIRSLHPALDEWMIVEGYGKVLSRPGLDLVRRELCVVAACAASEQDRQLLSHLHGALHAGATRRQVDAALDALDGICTADAVRRARMLWAKVARV